MTTKQDLREAEEDVKIEKEGLEYSKEYVNIGKGIAKIGLASLTYLGIRSFLGPEIGPSEEHLTSFLEYLDALNVVSAALCGIGGGISYLAFHLVKKDSERDLKKAESKLEELSENYKFGRGHI